MKIKVDTIVRSIMLVIALVNQVLTTAGKNPLPFSDETAYQFCTLVLTVAVSMWAWWKNNSITEPARIADAFMESLKNGMIEGIEAGEEFNPESAEDVD